MPVFSEPMMRASLLMAIVLLLLACGIVLVRKLRGSDGEDAQSPSDLLTKFREIHFQGDLSDEEFRTIKTKLADPIETEIKTKLKDNDEKG